MSDEKIIETADKWRQQERDDKTQQRERVWSYFKTCFTWVLAAACCSGFVWVFLDGVAHGKARIAEQARLTSEADRRAARQEESRKREQADQKALRQVQLDEQRRAQSLAWVECVNAIGVDPCSLVADIELEGPAL